MMQPIMRTVMFLVMDKILRHPRGSLYIPPTPTPPGPLDLLVPGDLDGTTIEYTNSWPFLHLRVGGIKSETGASTISVAVDGNAMTLIGDDQYTTVGSSFSAAFYIANLAEGPHTIVISVSGANLRNSAVRLGELAYQAGIGEVLTNIADNPTYYIEMDGSSLAATSIHGSVLASNSELAYPINSSTNFDDEQWSTWQEGMTARFATGDMGGEGGGLYVWYTHGPGSFYNSGVLYEILEGVLPADWAPDLWFKNNEQGAWYDPSDMATLFQDAAGTTPVTAVEQPVGLMLDKRLGLVRGSELRSSGVTGGGGATAATYNISTGQGTGARVDVSNYTYVNFPGLVSDAFYEMSVTNTGPSPLSIRTNGSANVVVNVPPGTTRTCIANVIGGLLRVNPDANNSTIAFTVNSIKQLPGNHAYQSTTTARPLLKQDDNGNYYLKPDGTDDSMATNAIDFTGTDKMTVVAGLTKLSDAAVATFLELSPQADSTGNTGTFLLRAPAGASATYSIASKGTSLVFPSPATGFPAPISNVLTMTSNISGPSLVLRANGTQVIASSTSQGTGNYGNWPLYLFSRANTSLRFGGNFYGLIIRGAQSSLASVQAAEQYMAGKTGVVLP